MTGFMRGFTPSVLKNTLNAGSYFSMLYYTETLIRGSGMFQESQVHFLASSASRTFQSIISNPLIVVKTRFEVVGFTEYAGVMDAFRQIL
jgi:solute carrier family 25, member 38